MKNRLAPVLSILCGFVLPLLAAHAQGLYSPASPVNTSNPYGGLSLPRPAPARQSSLQGDSGLGGLTGGSAYAAGPQVLTSEPIDPNHKLGRGDELSYQVAEDRDPNNVAHLFVTDDGQVVLPLGGQVKAAGKTTDQLRADIKSMLEREYYYHATISMGLTRVAPRASRGRVYVTGAVKTVGSIELPVDTVVTASQAIYQMGGPVDFSNLKRTRVMRKGGPAKGIPVNVPAIERGEFDKDVVLQPDDHVIVPEASVGLRF